MRYNLKIARKKPELWDINLKFEKKSVQIMRKLQEKKSKLWNKKSKL